MQLREVLENPKSGRQLSSRSKALWPRGPFLKEDFVAVVDADQRYSLTCCSVLFSPGLTDEEIDLAFQQSGTAADEPSSLGPATQVVPVQPPHLISQPYSKSPVPAPSLTMTETQGRGQRAVFCVSQTQQT